MRGGWCPRRDSNSHALRRGILNPLRLPFRHSGPQPLLHAAAHKDKRPALWRRGRRLANGKLKLRPANRTRNRQETTV